MVESVSIMISRLYGGVQIQNKYKILFWITSNIQRLGSAGDNSLLLQHCALRKFPVTGF